MVKLTLSIVHSLWILPSFHNQEVCPVNIIILHCTIIYHFTIMYHNIILKLLLKCVPCICINWMVHLHQPCVHTETPLWKHPLLHYLWRRRDVNALDSTSTYSYEGNAHFFWPNSMCAWVACCMRRKVYHDNSIVLAILDLLTIIIRHTSVHPTFWICHYLCLFSCNTCTCIKHSALHVSMEFPIIVFPFWTCSFFSCISSWNT